MRVINISQTCRARPSQWEGKTEDGRKVYIHYRWGHLSVSLGEIGDKDELAGVNGKIVFSKQLDKDGWDGFLTFDELKDITKNKIEWADNAGR